MLFSSMVARKAIGTSILVFWSLVGCGKKQPEAQAPAPSPIPVKIQDLNNGALQSSSDFVGSLEAKQRVSLASRTDGRIVEVATREGSTVKKGDLIVELQLSREQGEVDSAVSDVDIQRANLSDAESALGAAEAEVASAKADVEQSRADLRGQEAELQLAQANIKRTQFLVKQGAQSEQVLDDRTRTLNAAKAQKDALTAALNASEKALSASQERVNSARSAIDGQKAALNQAQSRVGIATDNLDFNRIVAPIDGVVGNIEPKVGDYVEPGEELTTITQDSTLELNIRVPIEQASGLKLGLPVEIMDQQGKASANGEISFISPRVDRNSQGILIKAAFNNDGRLLDDGFARARVIWSEQPGVLIPTEAVSRIAGKSFVFVAEETEQKNGSNALLAKQKPVTLGAIQGQTYQVTSGLKSGDRLVTSGILNLTDGAAISTESITSNK
jgi:RND family efflux transporter MFP subunit